MSSKTNCLSLILLIFSVYLNPLPARTPQSPPSVFDLLTENEGNSLTIEVDLTELINNKKTNQYFPGSLTTASGKMFGVEIRPRGKYRRRSCDVPPLKMKFRKKELKAAGLDTLNEIKISVPCFDDPESETLLLREYVAYRMFERLNPAFSVRARLVRITFHDKHVEKTRPPVYALLVEHEEQVAARLGGDLVDLFNLPPDSIDAEQAALNAMFQYMIGNTDWAISEVRNIYCLKPHAGGKIRVVPYDFDFSGLVNAPYAIPRNSTGLKNVRERMLVADGIPDASLQQALQVFKETRTALVGLCQGPFLSEKSSGYMQNYIGKFFEAVGNCSTIPTRIKGSLR
ncbi:MAG TPA: hypothetical protein PLO67_13965 [Saprospiraceae bacterium]|nr:hypothetical protein [Saprospiraceae bacterium]HPI07082.1 hypothetical protein [Saprospiraceae bacterium]